MSEEQKTPEKENVMLKFSRFIVEKRYLIFLILVIGFVFSAFSSSWVKVNSELTDYLADDASSSLALDEITSEYADYDIYVSTDLGNAVQENLDKETSIIMVIVAIILVCILLLTSRK